MVNDNYEQEAFDLVSRLAGQYRASANEFMRVCGVDSCWLAVDTNGDVWLHNVRPVFQADPNAGCWVMPRRKGVKRISYRVSRVQLRKPPVSKFAITEIVK